MEIANQKEMDAKTKKLTDKISKMSPQEFEIFMSREIEKVKQIENQIVENNKKIQTIEDIPTKKELTEIGETLVCAASTMACLLIGGAVGLLIGEAEVGSGDIGVFAGVLAGIPAMFANIHAYEKKPLSNYLNKLKIKVLKKKNKQLGFEKNAKQVVIENNGGLCK